MEYGDSWDATALRSVRESSLSCYASHLDLLFARSGQDKGCGAEGVLSQELLRLAREGRSSAYGRGIIAAVRTLEGMGWLGGVVKPEHNRLAKSLDLARGGPKLGVEAWGDAGILKTAAARASSPEQWEVVAVAAIAIGAGLRVGEACTVQPYVEGGKGRVSFQGEKSRSGEQTAELGPYLNRWVKFLQAWRKKFFGDGGGSFVRDAAALQRIWKELLEGSEFAGCAWHCLRRWAAATLWHAGLPLQPFMLWGGWTSAQVARGYGAARPGWVFRPRQQLPLVRIAGGEPEIRVVELGHAVWWPEWVSASIPEGTRREVAGAGARVARGEEGRGGVKRARSASVGHGGVDAGSDGEGGGRRGEGAGRQGGKGRDD